MHIIVDEAVEAAVELLGPLGRLTILPAREISRERVSGADALVVRSGVRVGRELLAGTGVRFVGTATAGVDHVDEAWLMGAGIGFAAAPGCNARAVGEWVVAALLAMGGRLGVEWGGKMLGVVGVGHVGRVVAELGAALGMRLLLCDPPRARAEGAGAFVSLEQVLEEADVVSLHVPLTRDGTDATWRMMGASQFAAIRERAVFINASRGEVVDTDSMIAARRDGELSAIACDVWDGEPRIDEQLLVIADIMTPHIAGYSLEGKLAGTQMVAAALARFFGAPPGVSGRCEKEFSLLCGSLAAEVCLSDFVRAVYDIMADDCRLREGVKASGGGPETLTRLRREYPLRRQFTSYQIETPPAPRGAACRLLEQLRRLGFRVRETPDRLTSGGK